MTDTITETRVASVKPKTPPTRRPFLARATFDFPLVQPVQNPLIRPLAACQQPRLRLPEALPGRAFGGGAIDDITSVPAPHLYVLFVLQQMSHDVVSGGGAPQAFGFWEGSNGAADQQLNGPYSLPLPGPGETWDIPSDHGNAIYQALTLDVCGLSVSFPMTLESWVVEGEEVAGIVVPSGDEIGRVTLTDNSTIDRAGLYTFGYTIRAEGTNGGVSDFGFSGIVSVRCRSDASL
ncbi:MAG: hypothetical protein AAGH83_06750 [Pseudomonadota bacterium]